MKAVSLYLGASGGEESHGSIDFRSIRLCEG